jgi:uncharacterized membrane protein YhaH (DUF805 family)
MDPKVIRYITENRTQYTREAIDEHLLKAGHSRRDIDAAWSRLGDEVRPTPAEDRAFRRAFLGSVAAMYGITFLVYAVSFYVGTEEGYKSLALIIAAIFLVPMLIAAQTSIALVRRNRSAAVGAASGLLTALVIPFVFLVIVAGLCTVITGGAPFAGVQ